MYSCWTTSNSYVSNAVSSQYLSTCSNALYVHSSNISKEFAAIYHSIYLFYLQHDQDFAGNFDLPDDQMGMEDFEGFEGFG